jgi:hypothetical protein
LLPRVRLVVRGGDCLGVERRLAAETTTGKLCHGRSRHHLHDAVVGTTLFLADKCQFCMKFIRRFLTCFPRQLMIITKLELRHGRKSAAQKMIAL